MPSFLAWLDHDPAARDRSLRILALFQERESRDELGLAAVRDSFADQLFPGTSTIQTRLRYMLFVPWIYRRLERERVSPKDFAWKVDSQERDLIDAMRGREDKLEGVFGGRTGRQLKRLPSSVYWAGLGSWGIRLLDLSQEQLHQWMGLIHQRHEALRRGAAERAATGDDQDPATSGARVWHPRLPEPPDDFPTTADFELTGEEAAFLLDRLQLSHPNSLLTHLARLGKRADVSYPWEHPDWAGFPPHHQELLGHARRFAELLQGASLLYNLQLAELRDWEEKVEGYRQELRTWREQFATADQAAWSLDVLWERVHTGGHAVSRATRDFVTGWRALVLGGRWQGPEARELIHQRETRLKGGHSRFTNARAREQWGGASGTGRLSYRWPNAHRLLDDLREGLERREDAC
jgi:hypothetical protein